jgi:hypothetical protein
MDVGDSFGRLAGQLGQAVEVAEQHHPAVVEYRAGVVAVGAGDRGQHQDLGAGGAIALEQAFDLGQGVVGGDMEEQGGEPADGP